MNQIGGLILNATAEQIRPYRGYQSDIETAENQSMADYDGLNVPTCVAPTQNCGENY